MAAVLGVPVPLVLGMLAARAQQAGVRVCSIAFVCTQVHTRTQNMEVTDREGHDRKVS